MDAAITTEGLTKYYGSTPGIVDLDLEVRRGEVFGFLGPNGAGKSTTIRTLLDLLHPTRGRATILGLDSHRDAVAIHRRIGYVPGEVAMYPRMTAREFIGFLANLRGVDAGRRTAELAARLHLDLDRRIADLSSGNRKKVAIVQAFMHEPELLVLDEPSTGLDPLMQQEFSHMIGEARAAGGTVFLSSHVLPEVERVADRVAIVRDGHLVAVETVANLKAKAGRRLQILFAKPVDAAEFARLPDVRSATVSPDGRVLDVLVVGTVDALLRQATAHPIENVISHEADLEAAFLTFYEAPDA